MKFLTDFDILQSLLKGLRIAIVDFGVFVSKCENPSILIDVLTLPNLKNRFCFEIRREGRNPSLFSSYIHLRE